MKKPVKIIVKVLAIVFGVLALLLLTSPLWLGPLSTCLANCLGPKYTETKVHVAKIYINPFTGILRVEDFHLGNPEGYDAEDAASVGRLSVDIAPFAILGNKLHVKNIDVIDPYASYLGNNGTNNFDAILANLKKNLKLKDEPDEKEEKEKMKMVIDRFHVEGVKFKMGLMPTIPIPIPVTLTNLGDTDSEGKPSDGLTAKEMGTVLSSKLSEAFSKAGGSFASLFSGDAMKGLGDAAKGLGSGVGDAAGTAVGAAGDAAKSVGEGAKNLLKGAGGLFGGGDADKK